ncbi:RuBisCO chaperone RbcX [Phormidium sp. CCY1219]|uniref:RuBisCO chaperone RbcX n=1 Tax=Phormidium sp. CCY1219 TaxID=2886104 RepID=UPI002D1F2A95|nr:chaperonin family protein RbcX [Phormidium sp. CCY1219]MEB3830934.1 chaperonin family protein RbcX [Phormidium sp. CCY1219]
MDVKQIAKDTAKVMSSYLTYQAMRTVLAQLSETNPPVAYWLQSFSSKEKIQDGEAYLSALLQENPELAFRLMTVRQSLAEEVTEYLPEMVRSAIAEGNIKHRKEYLERSMTNTTVSDSMPDTEH